MSEIPDSNANNTLPEEEDASAVPSAPPKPNVRLDSYQTESDFVVSVMAKNLKKEEVSVEFGEENFRARAKLSDGTDYETEIHCARKIKPDNCSFKVMSTKIEIRLRKLDGGLWPALEAEKTANKEFKPSYPSSSTKRHDWDKVEKEIKKQEEEEPDDDINSLFAKIYNSGDENTKRAMIKSMQESNGTVLSTNWEEVGKKSVDVSPPDGMEYKKWDD
ncbi:Protein SGT1 A [Orchesella cincta]|uniref:Protein SGT1 A n=1 Tax=Orchesella cincta TaxID=48709 RepID=A0A1D2NGC8_ORCCI|nr:Protein SGT1 A [Orchesella cincta]